MAAGRAGSGHESSLACEPTGANAQREIDFPIAAGIRPNGGGPIHETVRHSFACGCRDRRIARGFERVGIRENRRQCNADYAANKAAIKASGQTKKAYVAACRADTTGAPPAAAPAPTAPAGYQQPPRTCAPSIRASARSLPLGYRRLGQYEVKRLPLRGTTRLRQHEARRLHVRSGREGRRRPGSEE
jgi:hypothetical protein